MHSKFKQTVINNKIVYKNWFLRQGEAIWDFLYFHVFPIGTWCKIVDWKNRIKYALERAFTGFDRRISWGYESSIAFYKRLLSDLYRNVHGWPGSAKQMKEICPIEWAEVEKKWQEKLPEGKTLEDLEKVGMGEKIEIENKDVLYDEYCEDGFQAWRKYIGRVLNYFIEADPETSSKSKTAIYDEMDKNKLSFFDESTMTVKEVNGEYYYVYPSLGNSEKDNKVRECLNQLEEIETYYIDQFKLGMAEIGKNALYLND